MNKKSMSLILERLIRERRVFLFNFNIRQFKEYAGDRGYHLIEVSADRSDECLFGKYYTFY